VIATMDEFYRKSPQADAVKREFARVERITDNGDILLLFPGETIASQKVYPRMRHYNDARVGDRVMLIDGVIMGTWTK